MESGDVLKLPASSNSDCGNEDEGPLSNDREPGEVNTLQFDPEDKEGQKEEDQGQGDCNVGHEEGTFVIDMELDEELVGCSSMAGVNVEVTETDSIQVVEKNDHLCSGLQTENGCAALEEKYALSSHVMSSNSMSSRKRARVTYDEEQPSVHVTYSSLTRASKQKLEELLQQWSEWHTKHGSSQDTGEALESGEETFFPALRVGMEKQSAVSFWIDHQTRNLQNDGVITLDSNAVPLYDRGYALGLTLADGSNNVDGGLSIIEDAARCFNCGSYSHSLRECPKPRDNVAVNNARMQHKSKRGQNANSRNSIRYYEDPPAGKFDGLQPGTLDAETRQLLGLGELDPPPWLYRMRELGYPPGYLDIDDEDDMSGITIFADTEVKEESEDGEIMEAEREQKRRMTVKFPGINAPIPKNADERHWADGPLRSGSSRHHRSYQRSNHSTVLVERAHYQDHRWSGYARDDFPPGCEPGYNNSMSRYPSASDRFDSTFSSRSPSSSVQLPGSPPIGWSSYERGRRSPYGDFASRGPHNSPPDYGLSRYEYSRDNKRDYHDLDHPYEDRYNGHRHYGRR
ncbi:zinc finger CCHC domain-containing protein 8 isoform X2 [Rhodamnia argentea]|uniref:Zinc finger CCHC domain-containing protein 8 isoform X2 n=1 Tax=Rhodamnia argentea TaxID=178133 RepID=A0A8B8QTP7_9MYRT|nr:zinc finger CCHC domain-containing protein 8 isoform X2 [Rhodamnia argentea]